jgi:hypothetical protein
VQSLRNGLTHEANRPPSLGTLAPTSFDVPVDRHHRHCMGDTRTTGLAESAALAYREHAFLVDKQSLPHPGLDAQSLQVLIPWLALVLCMALGALWAIWMMRRHARAASLLAPHREPGGCYKHALGLFAVGVLLRLWGIGLQPADSQELTYLLQVVFPREVVSDPWLASLLTLLGPHMVSPHPPLYRLILMAVLGDAHDLAWLRGPAALAGAATVPVVYLLAARVFGRKAGVMAGLLLAVSPFHIYFSQTVTPYSLLGLWVAAAYLLHPLALEAGGPWRRYVAVLALGFLTHFSAPALFAPLALDAGWRAWRSDRGPEARARLWRFVAAGAVALVPFAVGAAGLFFYSAMIPHIFPMIHAMALFPPVEGVADALLAFFRGAGGFLWHGVTSTFATPDYGALSGAGVLCALVGAREAVRARQESGAILPAGVVLFVLFFAALGTLTILSNGFFYFASRRFVPVVPILVVLWAGGLGAALRAMGGKGVALGLRVAVMCALLCAPLASQAAHLVTMKSDVVKPDMRSIVDQLTPLLRDGDAVATGPYVFFDFLYSYHAVSQIDDWYQAGGAPRWVSLPGHSLANPRRVLVSLSDIALPWHQVVTHAGLKRIWLLDVDERPYGLRELEGAGTIHHEALATLGLRPCDTPLPEARDIRVRCYRVPATALLHDTVDIGDSDYRQVLGMAPPGSVRSYVRRLAPSGTVLFGAGAPATSLSLDVFRWIDEPVALQVSVYSDDGVESLTIELTQRKQRVQLPLTLAPDQASGPLRIEVSVPEELVNRRPACFMHRRERYRRGALHCGIYLREATLQRSGTL